MIALLHEGHEHTGGMDMPALIFMSVSWTIVFGLNIYCFAKVLRAKD